MKVRDDCCGVGTRRPTAKGCDSFVKRRRDGTLRKTVVWTLVDGVWTMETYDETVAPRELVTGTYTAAAGAVAGYVVDSVGGGSLTVGGGLFLILR